MNQIKIVGLNLITLLVKKMIRTERKKTGGKQQQSEIDSHFYREYMSDVWRSILSTQCQIKDGTLFLQLVNVPSW